MEQGVSNSNQQQLKQDPHTQPPLPHQIKCPRQKTQLNTKTGALTINQRTEGE